MSIGLSRSSIRYGAAALAATAALVAAGCGGSGTQAAGKHQSGAALANGNGVASKSPAQILASASAALRGARGLVAEGHGINNGRRLAVKIIVGSSYALQAWISSGAQSAEIIVLPNAAYIRASKTYWTANGASPAVVRLADRWLEVPRSDTGPLDSRLGIYTPTALAACLVSNQGSLTKAGTTMVNGQPAIVIKVAGDAPGSAPGTFAVATSGPPYPVRSTVTGPRHPGGTVTACNHGNGNNSVGTLTFRDFGHVPPISPPPHPIPLGQAAAQGSTAGRFAGYQWMGAVSSVQGSWTVPAVLGGSPGAGAGTWIGAEAFSGPFIQVGTNEEEGRQVGTNGVERRPGALYYAFWTDTAHRDLPIPLFRVEPYDRVFARLALTAGSWHVSIRDAQSGASAALSTRDETNATFRVGDWVQEDLATYPRLSAIQFDDVLVNSEPLGASRVNVQRMSLGPVVLRPTALRANAFSLRLERP